MSVKLKLVAFDFGHTLIDERVPLETRPVVLMPGVVEAVSNIALPLAVWANTRVATESDVRDWLTGAGLSDFFTSVVTSADAGARKPAPQFFSYALARAGVTTREVLFVGNQLNTDVAGAEAFGIPVVWLSGRAYRSDDDTPCEARPTYVIDGLEELPALVRAIQA